MKNKAIVLIMMILISLFCSCDRNSGGVTSEANDSAANELQVATDYTVKEDFTFIENENSPEYEETDNVPETIDDTDEVEKMSLQNISGVGSVVQANDGNYYMIVVNGTDDDKVKYVLSEGLDILAMSSEGVYLYKDFYVVDKNIKLYDGTDITERFAGFDTRSPNSLIPGEWYWDIYDIDSRTILLNYSIEAALSGNVFQYTIYDVSGKMIYEDSINYSSDKRPYFTSVDDRMLEINGDNGYLLDINTLKQYPVDEEYQSEFRVHGNRITYYNSDERAIIITDLEYNEVARIINTVQDNWPLEDVTASGADDDLIKVSMEKYGPVDDTIVWYTLDGNPLETQLVADTDWRESHNVSRVLYKQLLDYYNDESIILMENENGSVFMSYVNKEGEFSFEPIAVDDYYSTLGDARQIALFKQGDTWKLINTQGDQVDLPNSIDEESIWASLCRHTFFYRDSTGTFQTLDISEILK